MPAHYGYGTISGPSIDDAHFIARRWDPKDDNAESGGADKVVRASEGRNEALLGSSGYRDLWRSPSGTVYVAALSRILWSDSPVPGGPEWQRLDVEYVSGVFGLDDQHVFVFSKTPVFNYMHVFDGVRWGQHPVPGRIIAMHGTRPDLVYGVGDIGLITRWNGSRWDVIPTEVSGSFVAVFVASDDEIYALHESGELWEGSVYGWSVRVRRDAGTLLSIAKWQERVWVGTQDEGLCVLDGTKLDPVKPNIRPTHIDARGELVMSSSELIASTADGQNFRGASAQALPALFKAQSQAKRGRP